MIIYDGPSLINGKPIVVIAISDSNPKIGTMLCTWILDQETSPEVAALNGADYSICGDCKFRAAVGTARKLADTNRQIEISHYVSEEMSFARRLAFESLVKRHDELLIDSQESRTCYVRLTKDGSDGHPPADERMPPKAVWDMWKAGEFPLGDWKQDWEMYWHEARLGFFMRYKGDLTVRIGSYGDPAAVPTRVWKELIKNARNFTGYTHQWRSCDPELKTICMASVDTYEEMLEAQSLGWREFIVLPESVANVSYVQNVQLANSVRCPMTAGKNVTCDKCHMCQGTSSPVKQHIHEIIHGVNRSNHSEW